MDEPAGDSVFLDWLPKGICKRAGASLAELSGTGPLRRESLRSYVNETTERAWSTPISRLTCEDVRLLAGGNRAWKWLARPVAEFVHRYPAAELTFFPGDLTIQALRAFGEIAKVDAEAARLVRDADTSWMSERYAFSRSLTREAEALLEAARAAPL